MAKTNVAVLTRTHEGAKAAKINAEQELRRSVMACLLWENSFYESGEDIGKRIESLVGVLPAATVADIAVEARTKQHLRHAPLWLVAAMLRRQYKSSEDRAVVGRLIPQVVLRADEMGELVSLYWKDGKKPLTRQMKIGLANAFKAFDEYQLAKYDRDVPVKVRDVMFLCHPKPIGDEQAAMFKRVANRELVTPDTWEVALSSGRDKKATWERLIAERKLGALALIRNLRNMEQAGVPREVIREALRNMKAERVLPFRFIAAARHAPEYEPELEAAMLRCLESFDKLPGRTCIVVDNSGSMYGAKVSARSDMDRSDAACALAVLVREVCEDPVIVSFSHHPAQVPARRGFGLVDAIKSATQPGSTMTREALSFAEAKGYDRVIVITDEQSHQVIPGPKPASRGYFINVAPYQNGIGYGAWTHIDGWSEGVLNYIQAAEAA